VDGGAFLQTFVHPILCEPCHA